MATSTLLQYLQPTDGSGVALGVTPSNRRQVERFIASHAIAANDLVALDFSKTADGDKALYIRKALNSEISQVPIGFALNAATAAGDEVNVTIAGIHESANVVGTTAAGDRLIISAVAGQAMVVVAADTVPIVAVAVEADTANVATVFVLKQF
jgi:hypothetical protein